MQITKISSDHLNHTWFQCLLQFGYNYVLWFLVEICKSFFHQLTTYLNNLTEVVGMILQFTSLHNNQKKKILRVKTLEKGMKNRLFWVQMTLNKLWNINCWKRNFDSLRDPQYKCALLLLKKKIQYYTNVCKTDPNGLLST